MLILSDGRKELWQWDLGRRATVTVDCDKVHFANLNYGESLTVEVKSGEVEIPNKLLMNGADLLCWAFIEDEEGAYTKKEQTFRVIKRAKPSDYLYKETEIISAEKILNEAKEYADAAKSSKEEAEKAKGQAEQHKISASSSASSAADSAYNAREAETNAKKQADLAKDYVRQASEWAEESAKYAQYSSEWTGVSQEWAELSQSYAEISERAKETTVENAIIADNAKKVTVETALTVDKAAKDIMGTYSLAKNVAPAIVLSKQGQTTINLSDSSDKVIQGLSLLGKSTQSETPTYTTSSAIAPIASGEDIVHIVGDNVEQTFTAVIPKELNGLATVFDEVDFHLNRLFTRIGKLELTGNETITSSTTYFNISNIVDCNVNKRTESICTHFKYSQSTTTDSVFWIDSSGKNLRVRTDGTMTLASEFRAYLTEQYSKGTPVTVYYPLANPTEEILENRIDLLEYYTYYPNTTIYTDSIATLLVKYIADTKLYIDGKFAELATALLNT